MKKQQFKLKYPAPKGMRLNHGFMWVNGAPNGYWWDKETKAWKHDNEIEGAYSNCAPCKTVKAFKRMLKKYPILLQGKPVLVHREYIGEDGVFAHSLDVEVIVK